MTAACLAHTPRAVRRAGPQSFVASGLVRQPKSVALPRRTSATTETKVRASKPGGEPGGYWGWYRWAGITVLILLLRSSFRVIDTGEIGILNLFGKLSQLDPGIHLVVPFSGVNVLSTKTLLLEQSNFVPTKEGLTVELDTAVLYRLNPGQAIEVYGKIGRDYSTKILEPEASSTVRGLTSEAEAKALYTSGRSTLQNKLQADLAGHLGPRGIIIEDVLLKAVVLPEDLTRSIELKAKAEQESARMEFVLQKEKLEAQRKAIEAEGIAEFQRIVSEGITPDLLQWKGIETTAKLADSPNTKVVIMGNGKNSLPVILGDSSN